MESIKASLEAREHELTEQAAEQQNVINEIREIIKDMIETNCSDKVCNEVKKNLTKMTKQK